MKILGGARSLGMQALAKGLPRRTDQRSAAARTSAFLGLYPQDAEPSSALWVRQVKEGPLVTNGPDDKDADDRESFEAFLDECYPRLRRSADWMVGDRHLAQDMVQDTVLNLWRRYLSGLENGNELSLSASLAFTALRHTVCSHFRKVAAEKRRADSVEVFAATTTANDPATTVTEDDATRSFFESLGPEQQKITLLRVGGYTPAEIGGALGMAEGTVRNYLTTVRKALKRSFPDALRRRFPNN